MMTTEVAKNNRRVLVLTILHEMGELFLRDVCENASGDSGETVFDGNPVKLRVLSGDPRMNPDWNDVIEGADALILLFRFLDIISLEKTKRIYEHIPANLLPRAAFFLYREPAEVDYKISCPACGQKLWVHDKDENRRGRCPNCKRAFDLPSKALVLQKAFNLPATAIIRAVVRGDTETCRQSVKGLLQREEPASTPGLLTPLPKDLLDDAGKNSTVPIHFPQA